MFAAVKLRTEVQTRPDKGVKEIMMTASCVNIAVAS